MSPYVTQSMEMIDKLVTESVDAYADEKLYPEEWDYEGLYKHLSQYFLTEDIMTPQDMEEYSRQELLERLFEIAHAGYQDRVDMLGDAMFGQLERLLCCALLITNGWNIWIIWICCVKVSVFVHMAKKSIGGI